MQDDVEILWRMCNEHFTHGRHHETQRSALSNFVLLTEGGILAFIGGKTAGNGPDVLWVLPCFLIALGAFGIASSLKLYERFRLHTEIAGVIRKEIESRLNMNPTVSQLRDNATNKHKTKWYYRVVGQTHLYIYWLALHGFVALLGIILLFRR
jgi:hypothetical protein